MRTRDSVLSSIEAYLARHGISERHFGIAAIGDHKFMQRLRARNIGLAVIEKAEKWMASRPHGLTADDHAKLRAKVAA